MGTIIDRLNFFTIIYKHCEQGKVEIRCLPSKRQSYHQISEVHKIEFDTNQDVYFGVATRDGQGGGKINIEKIPAIWCDIDFKVTRQVTADRLLAEFPLQPTAIVSSGGGYHVYWRLKEPALQEDIPDVESHLKRLAVKLRGDICSAEAAHILRVPGTINHKYQPTRTVSLGKIDGTREYNLEDFDEFLPDDTEKPLEQKNPEGWQAEALQGVLKGSRNSTAAKLAGNYIRKGLNDPEVLTILYGWNKNNQPPLPDTDLHTIVKSIRRTDQKNNGNGLKEWGPINQAIMEPAIMTTSMSIELVENREIVEAFIVEGNNSLLVGFDGVGKSILRNHLALHIANGANWFGLKVRRPYKVAICQWENDVESFEKVVLMRQCRALGFDKIGGIIFPDNRVKFDLQYKPAQDKMREFLAAIVKNYGIEVIMFDCLSQLSTADINDNSKMRTVLDFFTQFNHEFNTASLGVHHLRKPGQGEKSQDLKHAILGATQIRAASRCAVGFTKPDSVEGSGRRRLQILKTNILAPKWKPIELTCESAHYSYRQHEPDVLCTPTKALQILKDKLGGEVVTKAAFVKAIMEKTGCSESTAKRAVDNGTPDHFKKYPGEKNSNVYKAN